MKTVVLARGWDPGLLSQRAWRRLAEATALWIDPTVARSVSCRLPGARVESLAEALDQPGVVLVVNEALRDLRAVPGLEWLPDVPASLGAAAQAGWPPDPRWNGPVLLAQAEPANWDAVASLGGLQLFGPGGPELDGLAEAGCPLEPVDLGRGVLLVGAGLPGPRRRPLQDRRVVVTRAAEQAGELADRLEDLGAEPLLVPTIRIEEPEDPAPLDEALANLDRYDWLIFTSPNAPARFMARLMGAGADARKLTRARIACIGPSTARALEAVHLRADLLPEEYVAEGLLRAFEDWPVEGKRVLLARAAEARDVLPDTLRERGATVDVVPVYRTVEVESLPADLEADLRSGVDLVTVTASSVARSFHRLTEAFLPPEATPLLAIGPITARTARELGYARVSMAAEYTLDGLVEAALALLERAG